MRVRWRLLAGLGLLALAFLLDPWAFTVLRKVTLFDHWGEMREGLTAAKFVGSGLGTALLAGVVALIDPRGWRRAMTLVLVVAVSGAAAAGLKAVTGRERPSHLDQTVGEERRAFLGPSRGLRESPFQSFPSGHTTAAWASATALAAFYPPAAPVCYAVAVAAGVNRVVKHQHFLSDVVAGALLGHVTALWLLRRRRVAALWRSDDVDTDQGSA